MIVHASSTSADTMKCRMIEPTPKRTVKSPAARQKE
jgi:hypothetical protein